MTRQPRHLTIPSDVVHDLSCGDLHVMLNPEQGWKVALIYPRRAGTDDIAYAEQLAGVGFPIIRISDPDLLDLLSGQEIYVDIDGQGYRIEPLNVEEFE